MTKKEEILECIIEYIKEHGYPPTVKEIGSMVGFKSKNTTWYYLQQMRDDGMIETDHERASRAIRVPGYEFVRLDKKGE